MTLLTQREAALVLRLSERTLERLRVQGANGPRFLKLNRSIRYDQQELERWAASRVVRSTSEVVGRVR